MSGTGERRACGNRCLSFKKPLLALVGKLQSEGVFLAAFENSRKTECGAIGFRLFWG
jgi:hypothetical protein